MQLGFKNMAAMAVVALALMWGLGTGCANIQAPMGGPKDTLAPLLIKANPPENTVNFKGKTINFQFSEYIKVDNIFENLVINPPADKYPTVSSKLKTIQIKLRDTLQPNTTYTFNFGNAIKDVNEGNPYTNFSYSFSTGPYVDSLEIQGKVIDAETGLPDSTLTVILHTSDDDSAVAKEKPRFVTRPNGKGHFRFDHLPNGSFHIFALKDEGAKKYSSNETMLAFFDRPVTTVPADSLIELRAFAGEKAPEKKPAASSGGPKQSQPKEDAKEGGKKLPYTVSVQGSQDLLLPLTVDFTRKVTIDSLKIQLTDTLYNPIANYTIQLDTNRQKISVSVKWPFGTQYKLLLRKGFATDSLGASNTKSDTVSFKTKNESDYGTLKMKFKGIDESKHPVLQWLEGDKVTLSVPITHGYYNSNLFKPGSYGIRILYDVNQNGVWDTGDYWKKIQPEVVLPVEQKFAIKNNWDNEFDVVL